MPITPTIHHNFATNAKLVQFLLRGFITFVINILIRHWTMKKKLFSNKKMTVDLERKPSMSTAPSTWSRCGSTLTSKLNEHVYFPFEINAKKKKSLCQKIQSAFIDIPRVIEVPREPEFVVVLVEDSDQDLGTIGVESTLVRNTNLWKCKSDWCCEEGGTDERRINGNELEWLWFWYLQSYFVSWIQQYQEVAIQMWYEECLNYVCYLDVHLINSVELASRKD